MQQIPYSVYLDKVYGAWLGKGVGGTLGAPYEGRKQQFDYTFDHSAIQVMLPNDDLDLQVLWLDVLERVGIEFTSDDLADSFLTKCPYSPGEYAYFKKNYARGIRPPVSGWFNNRYYINGMGCPIRSEIWGCIAPGNPDLAAELAGKDGVLDHGGDSVYAEQYLAAVEAAAFFESDIVRLLTQHLPFLGSGTRIRRLVEDTLAWAHQESDWQRVRSWIIRDYGHPDCTNLYQNIGFTILCLVHGNGDFIKSSMIALNCGFDTDCSCATAGALLGIIAGGQELRRRYDVPDTPLKLTVDLTRRSDRLMDLAEDTCRVGVTLTRHGRNGSVQISGVPETLGEVPAGRKDRALSLTLDYKGEPVISLGETKELGLSIMSACGNENEIPATVSVTLPEGWTADWTERRVTLSDSCPAEMALRVSLPETVPVVFEANRVQVTVQYSDQTLTESFGLNGAQVWRVWGPFWDNVVDIPQEELGKHYGHAFGPSGTDAHVDLMRQYHLNVMVHPQKDYLAFACGAGSREPDRLPAGEGRLVSIREDLFSVADLVGYQGPCVIYMERRLYSPEEQTVSLQVGASDAYQLWINGEEVSRADSVEWWTAENKHHSVIWLRKGENSVVMKCIRQGESARYSLIYSRGTTMTEHVWDLGSVVRNGSDA